MISSQTKRAILLALAALAIVAVFLQWRHVERPTDRNATLRDEINQLSAENEKEERLISNRQNTDDLRQSEHNELLRLRSQVSQLKDAERENARLRAEVDRLTAASPQPASAKANPDEDQSPEEQFLTATRGLAKDLGIALIALAQADSFQLPKELSPDFLRSIDAISKSSSSKITANGFELIYNGSLFDVAGSHSTILLRQKEPTRLENGDWAKTYIFTDSHAETWKASNPDDFALREKRLQANGEQ